MNYENFLPYVKRIWARLLHAEGPRNAEEPRPEDDGLHAAPLVQLSLTLEQQAEEARRKARRRVVRQKRTILVVDDNEAAAESLGKLLGLRGHTVTLAYCGLDAVEKARAEHPEIIVLDIGLPDIDGYEVTRQLREDPGFPSAIIALTGYGQAGDKERAREVGFNHHLTKPVALKELERVFKKVIRV
jgi:CheY-like chemotaxis protein